MPKKIKLLFSQFKYKYSYFNNFTVDIHILFIYLLGNMFFVSLDNNNSMFDDNVTTTVALKCNFQQKFSILKVKYVQM